MWILHQHRRCLSGVTTVGKLIKLQGEIQSFGARWVRWGRHRVCSGKNTHHRRALLPLLACSGRGPGTGISGLAPHPVLSMGFPPGLYDHVVMVIVRISFSGRKKPGCRTEPRAGSMRGFYFNSEMCCFRLSQCPHWTSVQLRLLPWAAALSTCTGMGFLKGYFPFLLPSMHAKSLQSCPTLCDPRDCSSPRLLCPWDSLGRNIGVGCHFLLQTNIKITRIIASCPITSWQIEGENLEAMIDFIFLGSKITSDSDCSHKIKRCLFLGRKAVANLDSILKSRDITLLTKVLIVKDIVFFGSHIWM